MGTSPTVVLEIVGSSVTNPSMKSPSTLSSVEQFLFEVPLYSAYKVAPDSEVLKALYDRTGGNFRVDGHCPYCHKSSTFTVKGQYLATGQLWINISTRYSFDNLSIECVRSEHHVIKFYFRIHKLVLEKIGQYPSIATVSNDEVAPYRKFMNDADGAEFHKAIGLAAHGVGVGSFVYLRRVFERLIYDRFAQFKSHEGWKDEDFYKLRMEEKVLFLKDHLPSFLVENRRVYSILSLGIHELEEEACLTYFEALKQAIIIILEDDKKTKEELERRKAFSAALAKFEHPKKNGVDESISGKD